METVLWSGLISLGSVWGIDTGFPPPPHQKHIDNVHPLYSDGSRLAFCSLFEGSNYLPLLFRASSFPAYQDDNNTPQADPLLPEGLFSHIAFPFSITKCLEGEAARWSRACRMVTFLCARVCEGVGVICSCLSRNRWTEFSTRFEEALKQQTRYSLCTLADVTLNEDYATSLWGGLPAGRTFHRWRSLGMSWTCREEASRAYAPWPAVHDGAQTAALHIIQHLKPILSSQLRAASSSLRDMAGTALGSLSKVVVRQVSGRKPGGCQMPHSPHPGAYNSIWITCVLYPFWLRDAPLIFNKIARLLHARE